MNSMIEYAFRYQLQLSAVRMLSVARAFVSAGWVQGNAYWADENGNEIRCSIGKLHLVRRVSLKGALAAASDPNQANKSAVSSIVRAAVAAQTQKRMGSLCIYAFDQVATQRDALDVIDAAITELMR